MEHKEKKVKRSIVEQVVLELGGSVINLEKVGKKVILKAKHGFPLPAKKKR